MRTLIIALAVACASPAWADGAPLAVTSTPAGATAEMTLASGEVLTCVTPCTLEVPRARAFQLRLLLEGHVVTALTPTRWFYVPFRARYMLRPDHVEAVLSPITPPVSTERYPAPSSP